MNFAIIVAAGKGKRMKAGQNKVFLEINRKPIIYWTILNFEKYNQIDKILIVTGRSDIGEMKKITQKYEFEKVTNVIVGGRERQDSSYAGLKYLQKNGAKAHDIILIHNGANPLIDEKTISDMVLAIKKHGAAVCGFAVQDTIKKVKQGFVEKTLDRKKLWQIQTPQGARFNIFMDAFMQAKKDKFLGTDDVMLVERLGKKVRIIKCPRWNIKMTYPEDLDYVKAKM